MNIRNYATEETKQTPHGLEIKQVYAKENAHAMHISLKAGESLRPHITPVDVFFYILEGTPTVVVGEEEYIASVDDVIESPKDIMHYLKNDSDKLARILVVKAPAPTAKAQLL
jgi:quercetin dioxygenase-like cupin family protein